MYGVSETFVAKTSYNYFGLSLPSFSRHLLYQTLVDRSYLHKNVVLIFSEKQIFYLQHVDTSFYQLLQITEMVVFQGHNILYRFLQRLICTVVSHIIWIKMEVPFFACSIAVCIGLHSICVWPGSSSFCLMISMLEVVFMAYSKAEATNLILFLQV